MAMNDFNISFLAGLDGTKSKEKLNQDIDAIKKSLKELELKAKLDTNQVKALENQLNSLKVNLNNVSIDKSSLNNLVSQINNSLSGIKLQIPNLNTGNVGNQEQQVGQQIGNNIAQGISSGVNKAKSELKSFSDLTNFSELNKKIEHLQIDPSVLKNYSAILDEVKAKYAEFGQVKITNEQFNNGVLEKFKVNIEQVNGDLKETKSFMMSLNDDKDTFAFDGIIKGSESVVQHLDKTKNAINQTADAINALKDKAQSDKIQLSFDTGSYQSKVDSLVARTNQWVDANGNARISTESLQTALNKLGTAYTNLNSSGGNTVANQQALIEAEKALDTEIKKVQSSVTSMNATMAKSSAVDSLRQKYQDFYDKNTASHQKWGKSLLSAINELAPGAEVSKQHVQELNQQLINTSNAARQVGKLGLSFFDSIKEQAKKFTQWVSVASIVTEGVQTLRKMKDAVIEVDSAMIELKKVSDASDNEIKNYFDEAAESAKKLGSSISDVINATADFSRLGYNLKDASVLAEVATLYKNVGDGITIDEASSSIVSTMKAFGIEAENAMQIIDSFNEVGNNFAISSGEIGDALKRSASSLAVGGNSLSEAIGLITAGNTVVQDADTVGTALKSMSLRITSTSAELEAMGEDTEFACETLSDYRDLVMGLTDNKVNIVGDNGEYKSTYEILKEISKVWDDMNSMEQSSLMKALFGVRQANIGASILENFDVAEEAMKAAEESAGSALKEQENYEKGIQYSIDRLIAKFQELSNHILDSKLVKGVVDFGTTTLDVIDKITSALTPLGTLALGGGLFAGIKNIGQAKMWACLIYAYPC